MEIKFTIFPKLTNPIIVDRRFDALKYYFNLLDFKKLQKRHVISYDHNNLAILSLVFAMILVQWRTLRVVVKDDIVYLTTLGGGVRIFTIGVITNAITVHPLLIRCSLIIAYILLLYRIIRYKKVKKIVS